MSASKAAKAGPRAKRAEHALYFLLVAAGSAAMLWFVFEILALLSSVLAGIPWRGS
ncbi:MAG: hypothetical protein ABEJ97_09685 [Halobellus sp.]